MAYSSLETALVHMENITLNPLTQASAEEFIAYLDGNALLKEDARTQELIETFEGQLRSIRASWAQEKLAALDTFRIERTQFAGTVSAGTPPIVSETPPERITFSNSEYQRLARDVIRNTQVTRGDRELFLFQTYFTQIHQLNDFPIDGIAGPKSQEAIEYHARATAVFLQELGAKGLDGGTLNIRETFSPDIVAAIQEYFGVTVAVERPTTAVPERPTPTISEAIRNALALEVIGDPLNEEKIREYQTEHNIEADGILGNETYGEMLAGKISQEIATGAISAQKQSEILDLLSYANANGVNMILLRAMLITRNNELKNLPEYNRVYKEFFEQVGIYNTQAGATPEGQALAGRVDDELNTIDANGRSAWRRMSDGVENGNLGEEMESLIAEKGPMMLFILAAGFVFGMIPGVNDSVATNSWWKRLLIAGVALANGESITDMIGDAASGVNSAIRSPEAQSIVENTKTSFLNFFETTLPEFFNSSRETLGTGWDSFVQNFETANAAKINTPEYIPNISEKGSIIISDRTFLNASKEQVIEAQANGSLTGIISANGLQKINELNMTPAEIKNYLNLYIIPRFTDDDAFVRDIFITTGALDTARDLLLDVNKSYISNPDLNLIIQTDINNLRLVGSDAQKNTATELAIAIQGTAIADFSGTFGDFQLENHPALTPEEKVTFEALLRKLEVIFTQERYIAEQIGAVSAIALDASAETEFTLTTRLAQLEGIKAGFQLQTSDIVGVGLVPERFSTPTFETVYTEKRREILQRLQTLGIASVLVSGVTINIAAELQTEADRELQTQNLTDTQNILESLGEVPASDSSINIMRTYYDTHAESFNALDTLNASTLDPERRALVDQGIAKKAEFKNNYTLVRQRYVDAFQALQAEVAAIAANGDYREARRIVEEISGKYYALSSEVLKNIAAQSIFQDLSYYFTGALPEHIEENSIVYLDGVLLAGTPVAALGMNQTQLDIQAKITELESSYDTQVSMTGVTIGNVAEIQRITMELTAKKEVVDYFVNSQIGEIKYREIAEQFKTLQSLYITAIGTSTDILGLENIMAEYRNLVQGYVVPSSTGFWNDAWTMVEGVFVEQDEVERIYEEKKMTLEIAPRLNITIASAPDTLNPEFIKLFKIFNIAQLDGNGEVMFDNSNPNDPIPLVLPGMENTPFYIAVVLNENATTINELIGIIDTGISQFSSVDPASAEALRVIKTSIIDIVTQ